MAFSDPFLVDRSGGMTRAQLKEKWGWIVALGLVFLIAGVAALYDVVTATIVTVIWIGAALLVAGVMQLITAFQVRGWERAMFLGLLGALTVIAGFFTIRHPVIAAVSLTSLIAVALILTGALKLVIAWHIRDLGPWGIVALAGVLSIALGVLLIAEWPVSGMYALGLFLALALIMEGVAWLVTGFAVKADYPMA